jgi:hypothetical protein
MRTSFFLISAVLLVAACNKDAETTAPLSRVPAASSSTVANTQSEFPPGPGRQLSSSMVATTQSPYPPGPNAKPSPFTTVTSSEVAMDGVTIWDNYATVICPAGSHVTGGGYEVTSGIFNARVINSGPIGGNAWGVHAIVNLGVAASFKAIAVCMS